MENRQRTSKNKMGLAKSLGLALSAVALGGCHTVWEKGKLFPEIYPGVPKKIVVEKPVVVETYRIENIPLRQREDVRVIIQDYCPRRERMSRAEAIWWFNEIYANKNNGKGPSGMTTLFFLKSLGY